MQCLARSAAATARKFRVGCRAGGGCAAGDAQHRAMPGMIDGAWMGRSFSLFFFSSSLRFFSVACNDTVTQTSQTLIWHADERQPPRCC